SHMGWKRLQRLVKRTTSVAAIYYKDFKHYRLPIPPLVDQEKIIAILGTVDGAIQKTDEIIDKTQRLKNGLMRQLFSDGLGHSSFKETEIGRIPTEWELSTIGNVT